MKLSEHLKLKNLSYAEFGRRCDPAIPRVTIRQYALGLRFPRTKKILEAIAKASCGEVTPNDFVDSGDDAATADDQVAAE